MERCVAASSKGKLARLHSLPCIMHSERGKGVFFSHHLSVYSISLADTADLTSIMRSFVLLDMINLITTSSPFPLIYPVARGEPSADVEGGDLGDGFSVRGE